jgi:hypothetical protein
VDAPTEIETSYGSCTILEEGRSETPDSYLLMLIEASEVASDELRGSTSNFTSLDSHPGLRRSLSAVNRHSIKELPSVMRSQLRKLFHAHKCVMIIIRSIYKY